MGELLNTHLQNIFNSQKHYSSKYPGDFVVGIQYMRDEEYKNKIQNLRFLKEQNSKIIIQTIISNNN